MNPYGEGEWAEVAKIAENMTARAARERVSLLLGRFRKEERDALRRYINLFTHKCFWELLKLQKSLEGYDFVFTLEIP